MALCGNRLNWLGVAIALALAWPSPAVVQAADIMREVIVLPAPAPPPPGAKAPKTNGLSLAIDVTGCVGTGYCPVTVTVSTPTPSPARRTFTIKLGTTIHSSYQPPVTVRADFELPEGASTCSTVVRLPQFVVEQAVKYEFSEDDEVLPGLSGQSSVTNHYRQGRYDQNISSSLYVLHPHAGALASSTEEMQLIVLHTQRSATGPGYQPIDLPELPLDYSAWDAVLLSIDELEHVIRARPECWKALRQWVTAGGNLWVYNVADDFRRLPDLEKLLDLPPGQRVEDVIEGIDAHAWRGPLDDGAAEIIDRLTTPNQYSTDAEGAAKMAKDRPVLKKRLKTAPFVWRPLGMGGVAALDTKNPHQEHTAYWEYLAKALEGSATWFDRHGVSFSDNNPSFWNFMIPGVGLAPIGVFQVLITLFVVVIGPVNYWLLRRRHKQSLLMFTVPLGAALVTGSLLLYAVLADGFSVRARTRSYTEIDQRRGEAACWSRIAYYAGVRPSGGLAFPLDVAVYPVEPSPDFNDYHNARSRDIVEGSARRFTRGWLPSRTLTQFLTVRARATTAKLEFAPAAAGELPQVTNRLGTRIEKLVVVAADGQCGSTDELADGGAAKLAAIPLANALEPMLRRPHAQLEFPASWTGDNYGMFGLRRRGRPYYYSGYYPHRNTNPGATMEEAIEYIPLNRALPPRTYVAIVERSPEFELGLEQATLEGGFHVIVGHW